MKTHETIRPADPGIPPPLAACCRAPPVDAECKDPALSTTSATGYNSAPFLMCSPFEGATTNGYAIQKFNRLRMVRCPICLNLIPSCLEERPLSKRPFSVARGIVYP